MSPALVHSLGTALSIAGAALCTADAVAGARRRRAARRRRSRLFGGEPPRARPAARLSRKALREWAVVLAVGLAAATLLGGPAGCVAGTVAGHGLRRWLRRPRPASKALPEDTWRLPLAADLMAACLAAGAGPREAAEAVGCSLGGLFGDALAGVAAELRLGGDPSNCWGRFRPSELGRCMDRASTTGVPPVEALSRLAAAHRAEQARAALTRARRAGVLATAPLGLCFLPAFLLVGVAPVVMGLASAIFGGAVRH